MCQLRVAVSHGPPPILDVVPFAATAWENDIDLESDEVGIDLAAVTPIQEPVGSFAACCACAANGHGAAAMPRRLTPSAN